MSNEQVTPETQTPTETQDMQYRKWAVAHINQKTGQSFDETTLPPDLEPAVKLIGQAMKENPSVASQALGDMSKSFFQNGSYVAAKQYFKPYMKARYF